MFAIGVRYLNEWALATHPSSREKSEWPPHPDRVFMALAAAYFETGEDAEESVALEWLESQSAPALHASPSFERESVETYVPVNDTEIFRGKTDNAKKLQKRLGRVYAAKSLESVKDEGLKLLPEFRSRQPRRFPVAIPDDSTMYLIWPDAMPDESRCRVLDRICQKVTYIGHSASLVQCWVEAKPPDANLVPCGASAKHRLRIPGNGRLAHLRNSFEAGRRPSPSLWAGYDAPTVIKTIDETARTVFARDFLILRRIEGTALPLESTLTLTKTLRNTLLCKCSQQPPPEWLSGHCADSSPSQKPHLAFFPLPFVGHEHADGHILGLGIAVPREVPPEQQGSCFRNVLFDANGQAKLLELTMGRVGVWKIILEDRESSMLALRCETWSPTEPCARWATVTPIVFDKHPNLSAQEKTRIAENALTTEQRSALEQAALAQHAESVLQQACKRIGLPVPAVVLSSVSMFPGAPHAHSFPHVERKSGGSLHHTHAVLLFPKPVLGPVLLGAGRYKGYGLCRPLVGV